MSDWKEGIMSRSSTIAAQWADPAHRAMRAHRARLRRDLARAERVLERNSRADVVWLGASGLPALQARVQELREELVR
jgi:hypothetical protein